MKFLSHPHYSRTMRLIALFEGLKAVAVTLAGFGCLALLHRDLHHIAIQILHRLHLNPAHHYPHIFLDAASHITDHHLLLLAVSALVYALMRVIEAYGLWWERRWAEWFSAISGTIYFPFEFYELAKGVTLIKVGAVIINVLIVLFMVYKLRQPQHQEATHAVQPEVT